MLGQVLPAVTYQKVVDLVCKCTQQELTIHVEAADWRQLLDTSPPAICVRLHAHNTPWSDGWLRAFPSDVLDTRLSNAALRDAVAQRLGVEDTMGGRHCPFCRCVMDGYGHHCAACMAGGDKVLQHNQLRNTVHLEAAKGRTYPELEKRGLLRDLGWPDLAGRRPADTLLISPGALRTTSRRRFPRIALDFAVVSPYTVAYIQQAATTPLAACIAYAGLKRRHLNTQTLCEQADVGFEPIVFESTGGCGAWRAAGLREHAPTCGRMPG